MHNSTAEEQTIMLDSNQYMSGTDEHLSMQESMEKPEQSGPMFAGDGGHFISPNNPNNPMRWHPIKKVYTSLASTFLVFAYLFDLTSYAIAISTVTQEFGISMTRAIAPFSLFLVGTSFAPVVTPHLAERFGRRPIYFVAAILSAIFTIGSSQARDIQSLCATRFFAGFFGGPIVVLIEGTYADIWPSRKTLLYYSNLAWASYLGAACGPLVNGYLITSRSLSWRWCQYTPLFVYLLAFLFAVGMPETYPREIQRRVARREGKPHNLPPAPSGVTMSQMARLTVVDPVRMLVSDPITILFTLQVTLAFGQVFQWFISVPTVLHLAYKFTPGQAGLAFISAIGAIPFAVATCAGIEAISFPRTMKKAAGKMIDIEYRLLPAFLGGMLQAASLFWIGWTAGVSKWPGVPIIGTWMFVWGNLIIIISYVSYIFDAYPSQGTLSSLTIGAVARILFAASTPLFIIQMITKLGGNVTYSIWGGISAGFIGITVILYLFGASLRATTKFNRTIAFM